MKKFIILFLFFSHISLASANIFPDPFGLSWDLTEKELKTMGFTESNEAGGLKILVSYSVPKAWSKGESYIAITHKGKLVKVVAISKDITDDVYGTEGKELYESLKNLLSDKYGQPESNEIVGLDLFKDSDEFYQCLGYSGCGIYMSLYNYAGGIIAVQIEGERRGEGYVKILYESPQFEQAKREIESGDLKSDSDAL